MKIIAELGSNWRTKEDCLKAIHLAKAAGADVIKYQLFTLNELYGLGDQESPYSLRSTWLPDLKAKSDAVGIEMMCTAFSPEGYDLVNPYVNTHKVASAECTHVRILEKLKSFGKPVLVSTGAHTPADIQHSLVKLGAVKCADFEGPLLPVILMYCVASYPAQEIDMRHITRLKEIFNLPVGYSDHSTDIFCVPRMAQAHGAIVLEKHFNPFDYKDTPDAGHALNCDQFKKMVKHLKNELPFVWGSGEENEMRLKHNRRLIAIQDIEEGTTFTEGTNFGIYRSLREDTAGLSPFMVDEVNGKQATRAIMAGSSVTPGDFK